MQPVKPSRRKSWRSWLKEIAVVALVLFSVRSAVADWYIVPTGSMKPTILEGDRIFVNKLAYDLKVPLVGGQLAQWADPQHGDIVVFYSPVDETRFVKRVVGVPGDTIELRDAHLFLNGNAADYASLDAAAFRDLTNRDEHRFESETLSNRTHPIMTTPAQPTLEDFGPIIVPPSQFFVMGDNRDNSFDSRFWGFVDRRRIIGKATTVVMSFDPGKILSLREDRFMQALP